MHTTENTYYYYYKIYSRHNYTTDGVSCGKHYEEYVKHRDIANSEKRQSRKQYGINIAEKVRSYPTKNFKYVIT